MSFEKPQYKSDFNESINDEKKSEEQIEKIKKEIVDLEQRLHDLQIWASDPSSKYSPDRDLISDLENQIMIKKRELAGTFEDLFDYIKEIGQIQGSTNVYNSETILNLIDNVRYANKNNQNPDNILGINEITRSSGLRDKVRDLIQLEILEKKLY